jgi:hypothetical protein
MRDVADLAIAYLHPKWTFGRAKKKHPLDCGLPGCIVCAGTKGEATQARADEDWRQIRSED